ncbi:hypothetical protein L6452_27464 [Arctium lappa]|uniref:Uncharacterized protein n=1 Tax=Arctium lappa TaxID=4217 RepID=A0ACB8ZXA3_ARCLA|nr:hypothetical protein L6452_27464 [Arctium lappa]
MGNPVNQRVMNNMCLPPPLPLTQHMTFSLQPPPSAFAMPIPSTVVTYFPMQSLPIPSLPIPSLPIPSLPIPTTFHVLSVPMGSDNTESSLRHNLCVTVGLTNQGSGVIPPIMTIPTLDNGISHDDPVAQRLKLLEE